MMVAFLGEPATIDLSGAMISTNSAETIRAVLLRAVPIIIGPLAVVVLVNLVQVGTVVSFDPLKPQIRRISPMENFRRILSLRSLVRAALGCAKIASVAIVSFLIIARAIPGIVEASGRSGLELIAVFGFYGIRLGLGVVVVLGILAMIDWLYQRWQYREDLKITRRELLDDLRRMKGDSRTARTIARKAGTLHTEGDE